MSTKSATRSKRPTKQSAAKKPSVKKAVAAKSSARKSAVKKPAARKSAAAAAVKPSIASRGPKAGKPMPRWSTEDVQLLVETVAASRTAKEAFAKVAGLSGRSAATVQAKYYQLQKKTGRAGTRRRGRPAASAPKATAPRAARATSTFAGGDLRAMTIDALVNHAREVKSEIDRRRRELDDATKLFK